MAQQAHGPEVKVALDALRAGQLDTAKETVEKIPVWRDAMGAQSMVAIMDSLTAVLESEVTKMKKQFANHKGSLKDEEKSALAESIGLMEFAYNMLGVALSAPKLA